MLKRIFPILEWLPRYKSAYLGGDLFAGITVGVMLIPQGMAYALIAGLPPVYGLYASIIPQIVYAFMGTSSQLAVGPVALDSLLVAAGLSTLSLSSPEEYILSAIALSFIVGILQLAFGVLRMGFLVPFLSKPIISGFTSAAALIIGASQLKHLLGISIPSSSRFDIALINVLEKISETNFMALVIGIVAIIVLSLLKKFNSKIPLALVVVILGISFVSLTGWDQKGLDIVGEIPDGFPTFVFPEISPGKFSQLFPIALTLSIVSIMEAMAITKAIEKKDDNHTINPNQEMLALGSANVIGALFQSYQSGGGLSRTAVKKQAGGKTGIAAIISALIVVSVLLFFTTLFYKLPKAILAAIIMVAVFRLIDVKYPLRLFNTRKDEFILLVLTGLSTLFIGIVEGLVIGVLFSLLNLVYRNSKPHFAFLANLKNTNYYKNIKRFPNEVIERQDLLILRFDAQLFFGNIDYFRKIIFEALNPKTKAFILNAESIHYIDSTAVEQLLIITQHLHDMGVRFMISGAIGPVRDVIYRSKLIKHIGKENLFMMTAEAVHAFEKSVDKSPPEETLSQ